VESANRFKVIESGGTCSFCEKERPSLSDASDANDVKLVADTAAGSNAESSIKICGDCAALCVEILSEGDTQSPPSAEDWTKRLASLRATQRAWNESKMKDPPAPVSTEQPMMSLKADQLKDLLEAKVDIKLDASTKPKTCSVCGTSSEKVQKVIAGPSVLICNQCVGLATRALSTTP